MNGRVARLCAWSGIGMVVFWMVGFWFFAGFVPPPSPAATAQEITRLYLAHPNSIRFGLLLTMVGSALLAPYCALISVQLRRVEGERALLANTQLILGATLILEFIFPVMALEAALFRPDRPEAAIQTVSDIVWITFVGTVSTAVLQLIVIGIGMLQDQRTEPIFPRWGGYLNIWIGLIFACGGLCVFFKTGPFAWNGIFAFWVPLSVFGIWIASMTYLLLKAVAGDEAAGPHGGALDTREQVELLTVQLGDLRRQLGLDTPAPAERQAMTGPAS
jgi:hypothetical protein